MAFSFENIVTSKKFQKKRINLFFHLNTFSPKDLLGATCATPPHLEGAPLLQIPVESLNCDSGSNNEFDNANVIRQLDTISKPSNRSDIRDFSDVVRKSYP